MRTTLLGVFVAVFANCAAAEEKLPLQPLDRPVASGETRCPPFFVAAKFEGAVEVQIIFAYKTPEGTMKRDTVPFSRAIVQLSDEAPSYEKTTTESGQNGARFWLSQAESEKAAACLPKPTVKLMPVP